jgi:hypothetical protein
VPDDVPQAGPVPSGVKRFQSVLGGRVDAIQLTERTGASIYAWADSGPIFGGTDADEPEGHGLQVIALTIFTAAGRMRADFGDWVVQERTGRFFPYKPALFEELFREVSDA